MKYKFVKFSLLIFLVIPSIFYFESEEPIVEIDELVVFFILSSLYLLITSVNITRKILINIVLTRRYIELFYVLWGTLIILLYIFSIYLYISDLVKFR